MSLYPNPTSSELTINIESPTSSEINEIGLSESQFKERESLIFTIGIYNNNKNLVFKKEGVSSPYQIDTSSFKEGIYIVNVIVGDIILKETLVIR